MKTFLLLTAIFAFAAAAAQAQIRNVDFKNFTYSVLSLDGDSREQVTVRDGSFSRMEEDDKYYFGVTEVSYGDLTGDGAEEAVVSVIVNTGGTGNFTSGIIFTMKRGKPVVLTEFVGGDRAYGGLVSATVENGILIVERNAPGPSGGACCAEFIDTTRYKWNGSALVEFGKTMRREIYPTERIKFKKGETMSIFAITLEKYERKRFIVAARRGQTLLFSSTADPVDSVSYDLRVGDGEVEAASSGIIVKLKETGDYVVEIANDTERRLTLSATLEIR